MIWIIKDDKNPKEIRFQLEYLPIDDKYIVYGQYKIDMLWLNFSKKDYSVEEFNNNEIGDILVDNYEVLIKNIDEHKKTVLKMKDVKTVNIEFKKEQ